MNTTALNGMQTSAVSNSRRRFVGLATILFLLFTLVPTFVASADTDTGDFEIVIPVTTVARGPEGSEILLALVPTPTDLVGATCEISAISANQNSVHPNNDLMVSGLLIPDVEAEPGGVVVASDVLVLGSEIVISLLMGPDEVFSAGLTVGFDCTFISGDSTSTTTAETTTTLSGSATTTTLDSSTVETSDTDATTTSLQTEVKGTQILPFTGPGNSQYGLFALALAAAGMLVLVAARSFQGGPLSSTTLASCSLCVHRGSEALFRTPHGLLCRTHTREALDMDSELWLPKRLDLNG